MRNKRSGQGQIEFVFSFLMFFFTLLGAFEICRFLLTYTAVANASRIGVRYATTRGATNSGTGFYAPSGPSATTNIEDLVKSFMNGSTIDTSSVTVTVSYPLSSNTVGSPVRVAVSYPYNPLFALPLNATLSSVTEGIITY